MEVIIYTDINNEQKDKLLKETSKVSGLVPVMVFDPPGLANLLKSRVSGKVIVVFLIASISEFEIFDSEKQLLLNTPYIFVLSSSDEKLILKAQSLNPKYLAHSINGLKDVCAVLDKMIQHNIKKDKTK
jgi:hypothetical protein